MAAETSDERAAWTANVGDKMTLQLVVTLKA
jgi:hypothetical protein